MSLPSSITTRKRKRLSGNEVHYHCDVLPFLEIREMSEIFLTWATFIEYITFCLSAVHWLNEALADQIK